MIKGLITVILFVVSAINASAEIIDLAVISNDAPDKKEMYQVLKLEVAEDNSIRALINSSFNKKTNQLVGESVFRASDIPKGLLLESQKNPLNGKDLEVIKILAKDFTLENGGALIIRFLKDGIANTYANLELELVFQASKWSLLNPKGGIVQELFIASNNTILGTIGIKEIRIVR